MKSLLNSCCLCFLIAFSIKVKAQGIYFDENTVWRLSSTCAQPYPCIVYEDFNYYINGDSVINSYSYKKVFKKGTGWYQWFSSQFNCCCSGVFSSNDTLNPVFLLREDNKKVFVIHQSWGTESLLYDFNLNVGDTLPVTFNNSDSMITVLDIDSIQFGNSYRKKFNLSIMNGTSNFIIEGVGNERGVVELMGITIDCGYTLTCFSINDTSYFPSTGLACEIVLGSAEIEKKMRD